MAGTDFTIYTRFNSGNSAAYSGTTVVSAPTGGNNPQAVDALVDEATYQVEDPSAIVVTDQILVGGLNKEWCLLGAQKIPSGTRTDDNVLIGATSFVVSDATNIDNGTVLQIESERMLVTGVSGTTVTVTRAYDGTTAAAHDGSGSPKTITAVPYNGNGGGFGLSASLPSGQTATTFTVVISFYKTGNVLVKSYTLTEANSVITKDAITLSEDFGLPSTSNKIIQIDVTPDPDGAIVQIQGLLNWNS